MADRRQDQVLPDAERSSAVPHGRRPYCYRDCYRARADPERPPAGGTAARAAATRNGRDIVRQTRTFPDKRISSSCRRSPSGLSQKSRYETRDVSAPSRHGRGRGADGRRVAEPADWTGGGEPREGRGQRPGVSGTNALALLLTWCAAWRDRGPPSPGQGGFAPTSSLKRRR
jgi:hypothetical protein